MEKKERVRAGDMSLGRRRRRPEISGPSNFQHRVHTSAVPGGFVGLPKQWTYLVREESAPNIPEVKKMREARSFYPGMERDEEIGYDMEKVRAANLERARMLASQQRPGGQDEMIRKKLEGLLVPRTVTHDRGSFSLRQVDHFGCASLEPRTSHCRGSLCGSLHVGS